MLFPDLLLLMSGSTRVAPRYLATITASAICANHFMKGKIKTLVMYKLQLENESGATNL
jgi:hypothetical protein